MDPEHKNISMDGFQLLRWSIEAAAWQILSAFVESSVFRTDVRT